MNNNRFCLKKYVVDVYIYKLIYPITNGNDKIQQ